MYPNIDYMILAGFLLGIILYSITSRFLNGSNVLYDYNGVRLEGLSSAGNEDCNANGYCSYSAKKVYYSYTCPQHQWVYPC